MDARPAARLAALLCAALFAPAPVRAHDPRLGWHTIETPHFVVHYHDGLGLLGQRAARALEAAHERLVPELGHAPDTKVQVVLSDEVDSANGSANVFVRPVIELLAAPPDDRSELNDYEDWLWSLVVHEHAHILHLDEVSGIPWLVNAILGRVDMPNGTWPRWLVEGIAVYEESRHSGGGRVRSSIYDMYLRAEVLAGRFFDLSDAGGSPSRWPRGAVAYLHGSRFVQWLCDRFGPEKLVDLSRNYGSRLVPFAVNLTAKEELGAAFPQLYGEWRASVEEWARAQEAAVRARGATDFATLTRAGGGTDFPRFAPGGDRLYYLEGSPDRRPALRAIAPDGTGDTLVRELATSGALAIAPDGRTVVLSLGDVHDEFSFFEDLHRLDLSTGRLTSLTSGERLTEPEIAPDGRTVAAVKHRGAGAMAIVAVDLDGGPIRTLYTPTSDDAAIYTPRFSPDGRKLAFSEHRRAGRDVRILDLATGDVADVTRDRALDLDPAFDPSGRWLLFASDRTGIYNLFAHDLAARRTFQVTDVLTGAFRPEVSPDGRRIAFVTYGIDGYDIAIMPFDPTAWRPAPDVDLDRPAPPVWESRSLYPVRAYSAASTLLPRYWLPLLSSDPRGTTVGLYTSGSDVVKRHQWALSAGFGLTSRAASFAASWLSRIVWPDLAASAGTYLAQLPQGPSGSLERQTYGNLTARFPVSRADRFFSVAVGYELRLFSPEALPPPVSPAGPRPYLPDGGLASVLSLETSYSDAQQFADAVSPETGGSYVVALRAARPELGGRFSYALFDAAATRYLRVPWGEHHALALRLAAGSGTGDLGRRHFFNLGGIGGGDPILDLVLGRGSFGASLRGYRRGAFSGNAYVLANAEYRFPLATLDAGAWTLPLYVKRLHAALTFDAGRAGRDLTDGALEPSAGVELRAEALLGYYLPTNLRLGWARGLGPEGIGELFFTIGSGF